ncbi:VRR-NUC domain-containing protein [Amylocystis lapponica]|nr:VRR-NUC domain-containing protein [Amylocystis lapponica]
MTLGSPLPGATNSLLFWDETAEGPQDDVVNGGVAPGTEGDSGMSGGKSMYVTLFEEMLNDVLKFEVSLFSKEERGCIKNYDSLKYNAQYLLIRLCLRKTDKWHRLDSLKYQTELGDTIPQAIEELCTCGEFPNTQPEVKVKEEQDIKTEEREIIDLTCSQDEKPVAGPSRLPDLATVVIPPDYSYFTQDDTHATLRELLECLSLDELKTIAKQMKVKASAKRDIIINTLLSASSTQTTLGFPVIASSTGKGKGKARADGKMLVQTQIPFAPVISSRPNKPKTQTERLRELILKVLGRCVRVNADVVNLFRRINLVYFRSTQHTQSLLTPSILARARKRAYAAYDHARTQNIWPDRAALLAYEDALSIEARMDALLDGSGASTMRERTTTSKTPAPGPAHATRGASAARVKQEGVKSEDGRTEHDERDPLPHEDTVSESVRVQHARAVVAILDEVYPRWCALVDTKGEGAAQPQGLERFDCGHILTRVVCKGSHALGILKEHGRELDVLEALLAQRRWRRGRRGRWYDRRALILMKPHDPDMDQRALIAVKEALLDDDTHIIFRPMLERRLTTLENRLKLPHEERHVCAGGLRKAEKRTVVGVRVYTRASSLVLNTTGHVLNKPSVMSAKGVDRAPGLTQTTIFGAGTIAPEADEKGVKPKATGKSIWCGRDGDEVSVEVLALQHYETLGYKGFHSEGRVVTTLFGLLFWDVLFAPVPGAFETPYQAAPLDIGEDTFYHTRKVLADTRLDAVRAGAAPSLIAQTWDAHAEKRTWCVGVRWDLFAKEDLVEIAQCLGGEALSVVCRVLCEDYVARTAGMPDLIVWNAATGEAQFVEVKGPGDSLQENQKVWIDVLVRAGVNVEVCHVEEKGTAPKPKPKGKKRPDKGTDKTLKGKSGRGPGRPPKRKRAQSESEVEHIIESEDEEVDYSQLDREPDICDDEGDTMRTGDDHPPATPRHKPANRAVVVIASSPEGTPSRLTKKRRLAHSSP